MDATDALPVAALGEPDLAGLLPLSDEAGWNQTAADWRVFLSRGTVFGCRAPSGQVVATAALLPYDGGFGWISMVLVTASWRRQGLATALVRRCVDEASRLGVIPVLDATPEGAQVYGALGFRPVFPLVRWRRASDEACAVAKTQDADSVGKLIEADRVAFGTDRTFLLSDFAARSGSQAIWCDGPEGAAGAIVRAGSRAHHIGPLVGATEAGAVAVFRGMAARIAGPLIADVPGRWLQLADALQELGFRQQRPFMRMAMGRDAPFGEPDCFFCAAGPEFG